MRRVVITGMGIWSCLGTNIEKVKEALYNGTSGIGVDQERLSYGYRSALTGIVETPVITKQMLDRHTRAGMSEEAQYAYMASRQLIALAGLGIAVAAFVQFFGTLLDVTAELGCLSLLHNGKIITLSSVGFRFFVWFLKIKNQLFAYIRKNN